MPQSRFVRKFTVVFVTIMLTVCYAFAQQQVTVVRDGSLIFAAPDNTSAVMDILSRGTTLELLEEGGEWHLVRTSDGGGQGYIRSEAVSVDIMPRAFDPDSVRVGSPEYLLLQRSLDEAQEKIRRIGETLERLDSRIEQAEMDSSDMTGAPAGSRPGAGAGAGGMMGLASGYDRTISIFYGAMLENTDFAAGLSAAWFPGLPAGLGLEFEAGAIFPENVDNAYWGQLDVRYPLANWERAMPYLAAGVGMIRRSISIGSSGELTDNNALTTAGGGLVLRLAGAAALQIDLRYSWEFAQDETRGDGRVYIGATLLR